MCPWTFIEYYIVKSFPSYHIISPDFLWLTCKVVNLCCSELPSGLAGWPEDRTVLTLGEYSPRRVYSPQVWRYKKHHFTSFLCHFRPWESKKLPLCWEYFFRLHKKRKWKHNICTAKLGRLSEIREENYGIFILAKENNSNKELSETEFYMFLLHPEYGIFRISCNSPISQ